MMAALDPQEGKVYAAISPAFGSSEGRGEVATYMSFLLLRVGDLQDNSGYVANLPTFVPRKRQGIGSPLVFGCPRRVALVSHHAHFWGPGIGGFKPPSVMFAPARRSGPPRRHGVCTHFAPVWAHMVTRA